jgi:hypothetical protein
VLLYSTSLPGIVSTGQPSFAAQTTTSSCPLAVPSPSRPTFVSPPSWATRSEVSFCLRVSKAAATVLLTSVLQHPCADLLYSSPDSGHSVLQGLMQTRYGQATRPTPPSSLVQRSSPCARTLTLLAGEHECPLTTGGPIACSTFMYDVASMTNQHLTCGLRFDRLMYFSPFTFRQWAKVPMAARCHAM